MKKLTWLSRMCSNLPYSEPSCPVQEQRAGRFNKEPIGSPKIKELFTSPNAKEPITLPESHPP
ncbi:hypothetical protein J6590_067340 [Homalodisca vitripennis]|nr:hypothetical protein J6590_067340 [Homalodisca vitripennis]